MDYTFVYLNAITIMSGVTQMLLHNCFFFQKKKFFNAFFKNIFLNISFFQKKKEVFQTKKLSF